MKIKLLAVVAVVTLFLSGCTNLFVLGKRMLPGQRAEQSVSLAEESAKPQKEDVREEEIKEEKVKKEAAPDLLADMDPEARREVNLFLSNFSEAYYNPESGVYTDAEEKIFFAYIHAVINANSMAIYERGKVGISATDVDTILNRFFGCSVPHETPEYSKSWVYENGYFMMPAASGDSYADFTIATFMSKRSDGNYDVSFMIHNDPSVTGGDIITNKTIYSLTEAEAGAYPVCGRGTAVLKPKQHNGKATYELVSYMVSYKEAQ